MNKDLNVSARLIAFYLPQYHPIPENDKWWRKGFTEWTNVGKARPLYPGHYQPRVPGDLGYYDLRVAETRKAQAEMARRYGIEGFCYWHYWFGNGKRLLERPFNEVLASGEPDFPFCLGWANESWRGFYHGVKTKETLIDQLYPGREDDMAHFNAVLPAFLDDRYIKVDGKPLFLIYQPLNNKEAVVSMMKLWRELAVENGLEGIYFVGHTYNLDSCREELDSMGFDALNPVRMFDYQRKQKGLKFRSRFFHNLFRIPYVVPYSEASRWFVAEAETQENVFPTIIPNWDHTPRTGRRGLVLHGSDPDRFEAHLKDVMSYIDHKPLEHRIAFVKSWNEWAEGNYLEPDIRFGMRYLEAIERNIVSK